jgi:uncharacterized protein (DUF885 family)
MASVREATRVPRYALLECCRRISAKLDKIVAENTTLVVPDKPCLFRWANETEAAENPPIAFYPGIITTDTNVMTRGEVVVARDIPPDFCCWAALWCLVCHEGRPGHELRYNAGVVATNARVDSWTVLKQNRKEEGWAVYGLCKMRKFFPPPAKLAALQIFLLEAAKCFLEIEFRLGMLEEGDILEYLTKTVAISPEYAHRTFRRMLDTPGQGLCYFSGYLYFAKKYGKP